MVCPDTAPLQNLAVSPGLTLRPSLSVQHVQALAPFDQGVAGVDAPAFVERISTSQ